MNEYPQVNHIVIYHDKETEELDGKGWCVEFSDADTTNRFGTISGALAYASLFRDWLEHDRQDAIAI